ncbi:substrate-binding periplasmic protein [Litoribrevibacter albus]|uniref:Solute-binding protein family 3/N-terminal domain-containing protein n=1 Tax=Litoribrevibacter albus TaxID=1473156 RepID=A0AA37SB49_9GAMM|nr:transporter substrate-binding domain-containing protein [Litoribrevibacter albus]GLQ31733.1 hypothetical protein GCM10007876_22120 [Litoribrevibacter albus]
MFLRNIVISLSLLSAVSGHASAPDQELIIVRGDENYPPYEYTENNQLTGFHIELVKQAAKEIQITPVFKSVPWKRALSMIEDGTADAITFITKTTVRERFSLFLEENRLSKSYSGFIALTGHHLSKRYDGTLASIEDLNIGVQLGFKYGNAFDNASNIRKIELSSADKLYSTLYAKRIDLAIVSQNEFLEHQSLGKAQGIEFLKPAFSEFTNYLAFTKAKDMSGLALRFANAFKRFRQTKAYRALVKKYHIPENQ